MSISVFRKQIRSVLKRISDDKKSLVPDTQNTDQNSGQTFEAFFLNIMIDEFDLVEMDNLTISQKKKIHPKATPKCRVFRGLCDDDKIIYVLDLPKSTPDFIIVHPNETKFIELKSIFSGAKTPKFNAGLNDPDKVRMTLYLIYKSNDDTIIIRHGNQIINDKQAETAKRYKKERKEMLDELNKKYEDKLGTLKPENPLRFENMDFDLWKPSEFLQEEALNLLDK